MATQGLNLTSRMTILCHPQNQPKMRKRTRQWYRGYAEAVFSALQHSRFQLFLGWLLRHEHIPLQHIKAIHIRTFPRTKANGRYLNGTSTGKGIITLYPVAMGKNVKNKDIHPSETFSLRYVQWRARATLIHEILHLKYRHHEPRVRQLTQQHIQRCMQPKTRRMKRVFNRIFRIPIHRISD